VIGNPNRAVAVRAQPPRARRCPMPIMLAAPGRSPHELLGQAFEEYCASARAMMSVQPRAATQHRAHAATDSPICAGWPVKSKIRSRQNSRRKHHRTPSDRTALGRRARCHELYCRRRLAGPMSPR